MNAAEQKQQEDAKKAIEVRLLTALAGAIETIVQTEMEGLLVPACLVDMAINSHVVYHEHIQRQADTEQIPDFQAEEILHFMRQRMKQRLQNAALICSSADPRKVAAAIGGMQIDLTDPQQPVVSDVDTTSPEDDSDNVSISVDTQTDPE